MTFKIYNIAACFLVVVFLFSCKEVVETELYIEPENSFSDNPWIEITTDDLHFIRAILRENHPGYYDTANPKFNNWIKKGFEEALSLAKKAKNFEGYYFAIQFFMNGFQDGHLGALGEDILHESRLKIKWPGFILEYNSSGKFVVVESKYADIPVGSELYSCDGYKYDILAKRKLQTFYGLWSVNGRKRKLAPLLLLDFNNPHLKRIKICSFEFEDQRITVDLNWEEIAREELSVKLKNATDVVNTEFSARKFGSQYEGYWISLPSFNANSKHVIERIDYVKSKIRSDRDYLKQIKVLVIDVRGNNGGSSSLGREIIRDLLPQQEANNYIEELGTYVEWRASHGNLKFLKDVTLPRNRKRYSITNPDRIKYYENLIDSMIKAIDQGKKYYGRNRFISSSNDSTENLKEETTKKYLIDLNKTKVYLLTDNTCFSACLGFADILINTKGVTHIGKETSADAIYIDNRSEYLPSNLGRLGFSMKVWRNRIRANNESYTPEVIWYGDINDVKSLEKWILNLMKK